MKVWQQFYKHYKVGGFLYAIYRGIKYVKWFYKYKKSGGE